MNAQKNVQTTNKINKLSNDDKEKSKRKIIMQRLIFIPLISSKVIISFIFCEFYLSYTANIIDTPYIKSSICLIVFLFFYTYYLSVVVPGKQSSVNKYFKNSKEIIYLNKSCWKDCEFCHNKKYFRSSHCRTCQQCILFRDHHCPYTANCIGFNNLQYFLNFLFWGIYAIIYYNITIIKFFFKKNHINLNDGSRMTSTIKTSIIIDFIINIFFVNGLIYLFYRTFLNIYENYMTYEKRKFPNVEKHSLCCDQYKTINLYRYNNSWNIGFLSHLYYAIGPTPLHLFFPINKFKNYILNENCPLVKSCKFPDKLQQLKITMKIKNMDSNSILNELGSNPDDFIKLSHQYYDSKTII